MNSVNWPIVSEPPMTSRPPTSSTAAMPSVGRKSRPGRKRASTVAWFIVSLTHGLGTVSEAVAHIVFAPESLDHLDADDGLVRRLGQVPLALLHLARDGEDAMREEPGQDRDRRHRQRRGERQLPVDESEDDRGADDHHRALDGLDDAPADEVAHGIDVVRRARDHLTRRVAIVEGARVAEVRVVEQAAKARLDGDADAGGGVAPREVDGEADGGDPDDRSRAAAAAGGGRARRSRRRSCAGSGSARSASGT